MNYRLKPMRSFPENARVEQIGKAQIGQWEETNKVTGATMIFAKAYYGKRNTDDFYYRFNSEEQRTAHIEKYLANIQAHENFKAEQKANRVLKENNVKVGDIYRMSWGYEQTNVNFFQVVDVRGQNAILREIGCNTVKGSEGRDCDRVVADRDAFLSRSQFLKNPEGTAKRIQTCDGGKSTYFYMTSYANAYQWDGSDTYRSWYY